jgi:hypothetical protein
MAVSKLTIWVDDSLCDDIQDPIASAVSNLEYDGFDILKWDIELDVKEVI